MVTYRLVNNTGFDVIIETDASDNQREFFITEIKGLDSAEVIAGFDVGIQQYNESQFVAFARDKSLALYSYDKGRRERCLVVPGVTAGQFNGISSYLFYSTPITLVSGGEFSSPLEFGYTVRFTQQDLERMIDNEDDNYVFSTDQDEQIYIGSSFYYEEGELHCYLNFKDDPEGFDQVVDFVIPSGQIVDTCLEIKFVVEFIAGGGPPGLNLLRMTAYLNGELQELINAPYSDYTPSVTDYVFNYGSSYYSTGPTREGYFKGIMRNLYVKIVSGLLIDTPDPSTGVNNEGADGTPNDIEQVTVII